jgi:hypothetical protein
VSLIRNLATLLLLSVCIFAADKQTLPVTRWAEGAANCTFRQSEDGHSYYGLSSADFDITLAVDRKELEKIPHRATPMIGLFLTFRYKGSQTFEVQQNRFSLEFVKHLQIVKSSLDPDELRKHLRTEIDNMTDEVEHHQIPKHPEQREQKESELQARLKDYTEMMDFISTRALRPALLDASNSSASGWVFFGIRDTRIGPWRKPEQFVLRLPVEDSILEFPFELPPKMGHVELRHRPD